MKTALQRVHNQHHRESTTNVESNVGLLVQSLEEQRIENDKKIIIKNRKQIQLLNYMY